MTLHEFIEIIKHNNRVRAEWRRHGKPIVMTTIGWRPDPYHEQDGYRDNGDGSYSMLIRGGTDEFKKQFDK